MDHSMGLIPKNLATDSVAAIDQNACANGIPDG